MIKLKTLLLEQSYPGKEFNLGARGADVEKIQQKLKDLKYDIGPDDVDGKYGSDTRKAVKKFQEKTWPGDQAEWDGIVGPDTWAKLFGTEAPPSKDSDEDSESKSDQNITINKLYSKLYKDSYHGFIVPETLADEYTRDVRKKDSWMKYGTSFHDAGWNSYLKQQKFQLTEKAIETGVSVGFKFTRGRLSLYKNVGKVSYEGEISSGFNWKNEVDFGKPEWFTKHAKFIDHKIIVGPGHSDPNRAPLFTYFRFQMTFESDDGTEFTNYGWLPSNWVIIL